MDADLNTPNFRFSWPPQGDPGMDELGYQPLSYAAWRDELRDYLEEKAYERGVADPLEQEIFFRRRYQMYLASFDRLPQIA